MATPHISAENGDFAKTVLMPGDPLRAKYISENFLENPRQVNSVRGMLGYTGTYKGVPVSVMGSGMGMPSIGIYSYELFNFYGVENIIRTGSAGAMVTDLALRDTVIAIGACTNSNYASQYRLPGTFAPTASYELVEKCVAAARTLGVSYRVGNVLSSDTFYNDTLGVPETDTQAAIWGKMGVLAVEMEAAALYMNAARAGKKALAICAVSDNLVTGEELDSTARQTSFNDMITLALETAVTL